MIILVLVMLVVLGALVIGGIVAALPTILIGAGIYHLIKHLIGGGRNEPKRVAGHAAADVAPSLPFMRHVHAGCPMEERSTLRKMERRLEAARESCQTALETRILSDLARARVAPPLEDAYQQIRSEIDAIYAFCERNDLAGMHRKALATVAAQDIYMDAYERQIAKVRVAILKTEECLAAYERTVATLEVSSVEADLNSDFDIAIAMLRDLRDELPRYNLDDQI